MLAILKTVWRLSNHLGPKSYGCWGYPVMLFRGVARMFGKRGQTIKKSDSRAKRPLISNVNCGL